MQPLVSILIPAYNAENWIRQTLESAVQQTYPRKEVILVNDGSRDQTLSVARAFEASNVKIVDQPNAGGAAARNTALSHAQGEYLLWLDHDDLLAPDKVDRQMQAACDLQSDSTLLSGRFGTFFFRPQSAVFRHGPLWRDLDPVDYFFAKFELDTWIHTTCWLVSRRLTEAAGPWLDLRSPDDDGEYFCRVVAAAERIHFVKSAVSYWRVGNGASFSYSRLRSRKALEALVVSTFKCIDHFLKLEDSARSRAACVTFLRNRLIYFYPENPDLVSRLCQRAEELGGALNEPPLLRKYALVKNWLGWRAAKGVQNFVPRIRDAWAKNWDRLLYQMG